MISEGQQAPGFILPDQDGNDINVFDFRGKWLILYFYPKDMTPGCTTEACNFQESLPELHNNQATVIGISKDPVARHRKFADKYDLQFTLVSDEKGQTCKDYGAWQKKKLYGREFMGIVRSTFIIDPDGIVRKVWRKVKVKNHHSEVLEALKQLKGDE